MAAVPYKIWTRDGKKKKIVAGRNLEDLIENVGLKMGIDTEFKLQLQDETDVDDDTALQMVSQGDVLYIVFDNDDVESGFDDDIRSLLRQVSGTANRPTQKSHPDDPVTDNSEGTSRCSSGKRRFSLKTDRWPHTFMAAMKEKRRPSPKDRLLTQKVIVDEFIHCREKPSRSIFRSIAETVVYMSPSSFENDCGTGIEGFARSLETTYYNHHIIRQTMAENRKQRDINTTASKLPQKCKVKDSYGCAKWQPAEFPDGENQESLEEKRKWLQVEYSKREKDKSRVDEYMECTYISQRYDINNQPAALQDVKQNWPFLFEPRFLFSHFKCLIGHDTNSVFMSNLNAKGESILQFMRETKKISGKWKAHLQAAEEQSPTESLSQKGLAAICTLPGYFQENEDLFLKEFKETATFQDFENGVSERSPVLAFAGPNPFLATKFAVCIDGEPRITSTTLLQGVQLWFMAFYVFNLQYPPEIAATLEFLQRLFFEIRPGRGSKRQRNARGGPNNKVITLCTKLKDHEQKWTL